MGRSHIDSSDSSSLDVAVADFRRALGPDNEKYDDAELARFLGARQLNVDKAHAMLLATVAWRAKMKVDSFPVPTITPGAPVPNHVRGFDCVPDTTVIHSDPVFPESYGKFLCYLGGGCYHKVDGEGNPLYIEHIGAIDAKNLAYHCPLDQMIDFHIRCQEFLFKVVMEECTRKTGRIIDQHTVIFDLKGMGLSHLNMKALSILRALSEVDQAHYPERLRRLFVINAPGIFASAFSIIKRWLDERVIDKIHILGGDYQEVLKRYIPEENLPEYLGGTCTCAHLAGGCVPKSKDLMKGVEAEDTSAIPLHTVWPEKVIEKEIEKEFDSEMTERMSLHPAEGPADDTSLAQSSDSDRSSTRASITSASGSGISSEVAKEPATPILGLSEALRRKSSELDSLNAKIPTIVMEPPVIRAAPRSTVLPVEPPPADDIVAHRAPTVAAPRSVLEQRRSRSQSPSKAQTSSFDNSSVARTSRSSENLRQSPPLLPSTPPKPFPKYLAPPAPHSPSPPSSHARASTAPMIVRSTSPIPNHYYDHHHSNRGRPTSTRSLSPVPNKSAMKAASASVRVSSSATVQTTKPHRCEIVVRPDQLGYLPNARLVYEFRSRRAGLVFEIRYKPLGAKQDLTVLPGIPYESHTASVVNDVMAQPGVYTLEWRSTYAPPSVTSSSPSASIPLNFWVELLPLSDVLKRSRNQRTFTTTTAATTTTTTTTTIQGTPPKSVLSQLQQYPWMSANGFGGVGVPATVTITTTTTTTRVSLDDGVGGRLAGASDGTPLQVGSVVRANGIRGGYEDEDDDNEGGVFYDANEFFD
ncbi:hypothetical protein HK102_000514, partial [Quaeritorhiza haematococci]